MIVLGIESSCDETAAALVRDGRRIIRSSVASQMAIHKPFRGVVPELASRAHVERINEVIEAALGKPIDWRKPGVDAVAVTVGPGLVGCLMIGSVTARMIAWAIRKPVIGVNHLEGHLFAGLVEHPALKPPFLGLIVSGGHTELLVFRGYGRYEKVGGTRDDAAGEAFDKVANLLDLPFPGGPSIDQISRQGDPAAVPFPRAWMTGTFDFSFSGIKTAVANHVRQKGRLSRKAKAHIAASFQESVVDVLVKKTLEVAKSKGLRSVVVGGGVAANSRLRNRFKEDAKTFGIKVYLPTMEFCTDNAAMIAAAGYFKLKGGVSKHQAGLGVDANLAVESWRS